MGFKGSILKRFVDAEMDHYEEEKREDNDTSCLIKPDAIDCLGTNTPSYIVPLKKILYSDSVVMDGDVDSILDLHEMCHVNDLFHGISLGMTHITHESISNNGLSADFFHNLAEVRAVYEELKNVFEKRIVGEDLPISRNWFFNQVKNYARYWEFLDDNAKTGLEKRVKSLQQEELKGIVPSRSSNEIVIQFDLHGIRERDIFEIDHSR